ncbi:MAG: hypothetical protein IH939_04590 [Acidobacteria bacterium]|nr:hypothetical protein [Acidobacteriota bacterium]
MSYEPRLLTTDLAPARAANPVVQFSTKTHGAPVVMVTVLDRIITNRPSGALSNATNSTLAHRHCAGGVARWGTRTRSVV